MARTAVPSELGAYQPVSDAQVLAALDRAQRHSPQTHDAGVIWPDLVEHLGFVHVAATTHKLRHQIGRLRASGLVERRKESSYTLWRLTSAGEKALTSARRKREDVTLPEAPQHRLWRKAQALAAERIEDLRDELSQTLEEAGTLLTGGDGGDFAAWYEVRKRLDERCLRLGAAIYCLQEWREPDDARADRDRSKLRERGRSFNWSVLRGESAR